MSFAHNRWRKRDKKGIKAKFDLNIVKKNFAFIFFMRIIPLFVVFVITVNAYLASAAVRALTGLTKQPDSELLIV